MLYLLQRFLGIAVLDILRDKKMDNSFQASLRENTPWKEASNRVLTLAFALLSCRTLDGALSDSFLLCKNRLMPPLTELLGSPVTVLGMRIGSLFGIFSVYCSEVT